VNLKKKIASFLGEKKIRVNWLKFILCREQIQINILSLVNYKIFNENCQLHIRQINLGVMFFSKIYHLNYYKTSNKYFISKIRIDFHKFKIQQKQKAHIFIRKLLQYQCQMKKKIFHKEYYLKEVESKKMIQNILKDQMFV
jgi:hypothetical protein